MTGHEIISSEQTAEEQTSARDPLSPMEISVSAYAVVDRNVRLFWDGETAFVNLPREWVGKRVRIFLMDEWL
ncbi:MAG TPA: DUF2080 family transposase-associated protein [Methanocorpusculum sp.]|nr:DUF2080 family transposase-associated protein [Methanocorpusculum sp.]